MLSSRARRGYSTGTEAWDMILETEPRSDDPETLSVVRLQLPLNTLNRPRPARSPFSSTALHHHGWPC
ncbi:unnamed protein product [Boreogadus saida]